MIDRKAIDAAMLSVLGRRPEGAAYGRCQAAFANLNDLVESLVASDEFRTRSWHIAAATARRQVAERWSWSNGPSDIEWTYQTLLGRAPENYPVIAAWMLHSLSKEQLVERFILSPEFKSHAWHKAAAIVREEFAVNKGAALQTKKAALV